MSTQRMPGFLKGIQKDIGHTKTKLLQLTGTIDKTVDGEFEISRLNLDDSIKFTTNLLKDVAKFDQQIEEIIVDPIKSVAEDIAQFLANHPEAEENTKGDLLDVAAWSNNIVMSYLKKEAQFAIHAKVALERLSIIKKKIEKRDKLLLDLDSNRAKLQSATEQNKQDPKLEAKCKDLQQQYDHINSELKSQIAYEVEFLDNYFTKELKLLHSRQREVYFAMAESFKTIMDAETLIQIGSGSFVVSSASQYEALASPNPLPDQQPGSSPSSELSKSPSSPLMGKLRNSTTKISSLVDRRGTTTAASPRVSTAPTPIPATASSTTTASSPQPSSPTPPPKPAKPSLRSSGEIGSPPKRPPPKPSTTAAVSPSASPEQPQLEQPAPESSPSEAAPEESGELNISEYHYDYTNGNASHSLISNEKRKTVMNPRFSAMMDTFSTTSAFGNPKDFSGMFGSDSPN